ncbi:molybdopterin molybdotransferase MoeA [Nesterenkonia sp. HG001]|uniref:molybdopterin molybdotransferase MoeA n=1 Tax=Nesterenkonia sp. HG001 TaxID=2983207 RepID=UPI002AC61F28|nr:molybdopterin molybdotransferase MoeA [Nesterenkonia sp. HG001]MDZ5078910.1 molybdopterin molybdotransferase MoeA [Nesterenkonia sp. HG001]
MSLTPLPDARRRTAEAAAALCGPGVGTPLDAAHGALLAAPVRALQPIPHAATSAMDGWAIRGEGPWRPHDEAPSDPGPSGRTALSPVDPRPALEDGQAVAVVTGSPIPAGTTSVLRSEHARLDQGGDGHRLLHADPGSEDVEPGRHLRPSGSEAAGGEVLLSPGERLTPARAAMAAVAGHDTVVIHPLPSVRLICTGEEVITSGLPGPGQVRDAFEISVPAAVAAMGGRMAGVHRVGDDASALTRRLQEAIADGVGLVLTTGGTARSEADALRAALQDLGAEPLVDSVDMRPGHPAVLARVGGTLVLGLPGNPLAGFAALAALGQVALDALRGVPAEAAVGLPRSTSSQPLEGARRGLRLLPVELHDDGVAPVGHDKPHMMRGLASADAFALVPPGGLEAGATVEVLPLAWQAGSTPLGRRST